MYKLKNFKIELSISKLNQIKKFYSFLLKLIKLNNLKKNVNFEPESYTDKIVYRMVFDRRKVLSQFADKYEIRNYVKQICGEEYLAKIYGVAQNSSEIDWDKLPRNFVIKTNHGSGGLIGIWEGVELEANLPEDLSNLGWTRWWVHPEKFNQSIAEKMVSRWLQLNYALRKDGPFEWAYLDISRKVYLEEVLVNTNGTLASPWQFFVFGGKVKLIRLSGRGHDLSRSFAYVDNNWTEMQVSLTEEKNRMPTLPPKPSNLAQMVSIAEDLANKIDFVRVDLYNTGENIYFSELTNYPSAGIGVVKPKNFNLELGKYWILDIK